jgi:hypothetical protein
MGVSSVSTTILEAEGKTDKNTLEQTQKLRRSERRNFKQFDKNKLLNQGIPIGVKQ